MQLGMIGLGRMGASMVRRLTKGGHECVVYDVHAEAVKDLQGQGAVGASFARRPGRAARQAARGLGDGARRRGRSGAGGAGAAAGSRRHRHRRRQLAITATTSGAAPELEAARASTTSMSAPAAACPGSSAATA